MGSCGAAMGRPTEAPLWGAGANVGTGASAERAAEVRRMRVYSLSPWEKAGPAVSKNGV